jgi:hypothetical protein
MLHTYEAVLKGNQLEWRQEMPQKAGDEHTMVVLVTILAEEPVLPKQAQPGKRMAEALEKLARIHALAILKEPNRWEREIRQDRHLPGRA